MTIDTAPRSHQKRTLPVARFIFDSYDKQVKNRAIEDLDRTNDRLTLTCLFDHCRFATTQYSLLDDHMNKEKHHTHGHDRDYYMKLARYDALIAILHRDHAELWNDSTHRPNDHHHDSTNKKKERYVIEQITISDDDEVSIGNTTPTTPSDDESDEDTNTRTKQTTQQHQQQRHQQQRQQQQQQQQRAGVQSFRLKTKTRVSF